MPEGAEALFLCLIARCRSRRIAPATPPTLSSLADEKRVARSFAAQRRAIRCERRRRRIPDVRAADLRRRRRNTLFRSVISDEDGGNPANIAASEASHAIQRDARATI